MGHSEFATPKDSPNGDVSWAIRCLNYRERGKKSVIEIKCVCGRWRYCNINIKL